ncbi:ERF family protein [Ligilactobacillus salivarius]|uniref:ERF family protein n=1 Tax=Ligilactobacillus salivarius TaxID=1624 RepID=UPI001F507DE5|nr:ERF family protein [Ligilactobacillus salivarius]
MNTFRSQLKQPVKDAKNPFFKSNYVTLEGVQNAIDAAIKGTGLAYTQIVKNDDSGNVGVETIITHESGQYLTTGVLALRPEKATPQGYGSTITYAKRYQLSSAFGVSSDVDDDGNIGSGNLKAQVKGNYQQNNYKQNYQQPRQRVQQKQVNPEIEYSSLFNKALKTLGTDKDDLQAQINGQLTQMFPDDTRTEDKFKHGIMILKGLIENEANK